MESKIICDDCLVAMDGLETGSIDCIITDPPYELGFMGKSWDKAGIALSADTWAKCLRVLKPGGYLLCFGGSRTFHRITCAIEDAGFEIRDVLMWLYLSGFPKSMNIGLAVDKKRGVESRVVGVGRSGTSIRTYQSLETTTAGEYEKREAQNEWNGWGTAIKPSYEPIVMARKPFKGSLIDNVLQYNIGGLNIDGCRVPMADEKDAETYRFNNNGNTRLKKPEGEKTGMFEGGWRVQKQERENPSGRFPANTIWGEGLGEKYERYFYCPKA